MIPLCIDERFTSCLLISLPIWHDQRILLVKIEVTLYVTASSILFFITGLALKASN